jgi:hypothetical protein
MNTILLLLALVMLALVLMLWGLVAMASWSDRQIAHAWQEWLKAKADAEAVVE